MKQLLIILVFLLTIFAACKTTGEKWYDSNTELEYKFGNYMNSIIFKEVSEADMTLFGVNAYSSQSLFVYYFMTSVGYANIIKNRAEFVDGAEFIDEFLPGMERALELMTTKEAMQFDTDAWGGNALEDFKNGKTFTHGAFMFYYNFAIGLHVSLIENSKYTALHDSISKFLLGQMGNNLYKGLETYPDEYWPADMSVAYGSLGVYAKNTNKDATFSLRLANNFLTNFCDSNSYLVYQNIGITENNEIYYSETTGSSSAYSAFFLAHLDEWTAEAIFSSVKFRLYKNNILYSGVQENTQDSEDITYGPVIAGLGIVASGFSLGNAKIFAYKDVFKNLYGTASKVGMSSKSSTEFKFRLGTHIGNSIMFAVLTSGSFTKEVRGWEEGKGMQNEREMRYMRESILNELIDLVFK